MLSHDQRIPRDLSLVSFRRPTDTVTNKMWVNVTAAQHRIVSTGAQALLFHGLPSSLSILSKQNVHLLKIRDCWCDPSNTWGKSPHAPKVALLLLPASSLLSESCANHWTQGVPPWEVWRNRADAKTRPSHVQYVIDCCSIPSPFCSQVNIFVIPFIDYSWCWTSAWWVQNLSLHSQCLATCLTLECSRNALGETSHSSI